MKNVLIILLVVALVACDSDGYQPIGGERVKEAASDEPGAAPGDSDEQAAGIQGLDLSGTWLMAAETRMSKIETGEYLSSDFTKFRYILEDTDNGVRYDRCWTYGDALAPYGIKTETRFYMDVTKEGFKLQSDGSLQQSWTYELERRPGLSFTSIETLVKLSDDVEFDGGTFVLNGPISLEEYSHVCVWHTYSSIGNRRTIEILTPYDDDYASLNFRLIGDVAEGVYEYATYNSAKEVEINVSSSATKFWEQVGSNGLFPSDVAVNILESTSDRMSGSFSFIGQDSGQYDGQFEIFLKN